MAAIVAMEERHGALRASDADREQAVEVLKDAFVQDRLPKAEFEAHVGRALASRTYAELGMVTAGIAAPLSTVQPPSMPSPMAEQRARPKISEAELAEAVGVSRQTIILIENCRYLPSLPLAFTIARFFGLTVDDMFGYRQVCPSDGAPGHVDRPVFKTYRDSAGLAVL